MLAIKSLLLPQCQNSWIFSLICVMGNACLCILTQKEKNVVGKK